MTCSINEDVRYLVDYAHKQFFIHYFPSIENMKKESHNTLIVNEVNSYDLTPVLVKQIEDWKSEENLLMKKKL